ncbi:MAG: phage portal protein [Muribaculaceae bacterium]|nr:phage portal protein [Muribaculaceae bacterium]
MPWGGDNLMPYDILEKIEADETMVSCLEFNSEMCYGAGLTYDVTDCLPKDARRVKDFFEDNAVERYFMGVCHDFKYFGFCVSVIILSKNFKNIVRIRRKEAIYCRFGVADKSGRISRVYYANWRQNPDEKDIEEIEMLDEDAPLADLRERIEKGTASHKYAVVSRIPTVDSTYYPIPYYAALFKGHWYDIKQLIGAAKSAKLRNSAPLKYHIQIQSSYWEKLYEQEGITDPEEQRERANRQKQIFIDYLTGAENSGKVLFSEFEMNFDGKLTEDIRITKLDTATQGGDWSTDIQEAVNMICFVLRVHPNLLGAVPGKSQSNNSGSDKRELYTIAQAIQKAHRDLLFSVHRLIIRFNNYAGARPVCPILQLTTLDEHRDIKQSEI